MKLMSVNEIKGIEGSECRKRSLNEGMNGGVSPAKLC